MNKASFINIVKTYYNKHGRHDLPWRQTTDPYKITVSEIMLQQTQVARVVEKYTLFIKKFSTVQQLAKAPLSEVLTLWSGLGYNRRAKFLHAMAKTIVADYGGVFPRTQAALKLLPGIGDYTAGAIAAFAFNNEAFCIETNIRTVYIHHFFSDQSNISDAVLLPYIKKTLDTKHPREWYWALMDYGSFLKSQGVVVHRNSTTYNKQSRFEGSRRQVRGAIIRALLAKPKTISQLEKQLKKSQLLLDAVCHDLIKEGMIQKKNKTYTLI